MVCPFKEICHRRVTHEHFIERCQGDESSYIECSYHGVYAKRKTPSEWDEK